MTNASIASTGLPTSACSGSSALIARIRGDIAAGGDEQMLCAVWREFSPEVERLIDYLPDCGDRPADAARGEYFEKMPAWQILRILLAQQALSAA